MIDYNKTLKATKITCVTLVGYFINEYPAKYGNCFSLSTKNGNDYRIINFNYENLEELLRRKEIKFPITIIPLGDTSKAILADERIPNNWYNNSFCETCTPIELLPITQRLNQILDIKRGVREEKEIDINGKKMTLISVNVLTNKKRWKERVNK